MDTAEKYSPLTWADSEMSSLAKRSFFGTMEASSAGSLATDRNGIIVWINEKYCQLLRVDADNLIGRSVVSVLPGTRIPEVLASGRSIVLDVMQHDGCEYLVSRFPVFDAQSEVIGAFGFVLNNPYEDSAWMRNRSSQSPNKRLALHQSIFIGSSDHAQKVRLLAEKCSRTDVSVLITGPTGSGKEIVAQMIHRYSTRSRGNFVAINVGAIPEALFEAEFFGTAPGAYTGADRRGRPGKLQLADGGTLFLDELGDMPRGAQVKLLRFLETGEFESLGSNQLRRADVRLIGATSVDLREAIARKEFRADLYYRLAVFPIAVPALRERIEDIPELCAALIEQINGKHNSFQTTLLPCALARLKSLEWPGNVRELRNLLERCAIFAEGEPVDTALVDTMVGYGSVPTVISETGPARQQSLPQAIEALEAQEIALALATCDGSAALAARRLGISRTTLYKKAKQFGFPLG